MEKKLSRQQRRAMERAQRKGRTTEINTELGNIQPNAPKNQKSGWVPMHQSIEVAGRKIPGMVYFGKPPISSDSKLNQTLSNFYINPELEVADNRNDSKSGFYSDEIAFDQLEPIDRANYLDWLASERIDLSYCDEYMVLYFLGLEWAYFDKDISDKERKSVYFEIQRLWDNYHNSEFGYLLDNIIGFLICQNYMTGFFDAKDAFAHGDRRMLYHHDGGIKVLNNKPLKAPHVDTVLKFSEHQNIEGVREICPYVFERQFETRFNKEFPNGINIEKPKQYIDNQYISEFQDFQIDEKVKYEGKEVPDINYSSELLSVAEKTGRLVANDLTQYSNEIENSVQNIISNERLEFLPRTNYVETDNKYDQIVRNWVKEQPQRPDEITAENLALFTDFSSLLEEDLSPWFRIVVALERVGYGIAPELGLYLYNLDRNAPISLFKLESTPESRQQSSGKYYSVLFSLIVGILLFKADKDSLDDADLELLLNRISAMDGLTEYENELLDANLVALQRIYINPLYLIRFFMKGIFIDQEFFRESIKIFVEGAESISNETIMLIFTLYKSLKINLNDIASDFNLPKEAREMITGATNFVSKHNPNSANVGTV